MIENLKLRDDRIDKDYNKILKSVLLSLLNPSRHTEE